MMLKKLKTYLWWKGKLAVGGDSGKVEAKGGVLPFGVVGSGPVLGGDAEMSDALKKKDRDTAKRVQSRRRVRGGAPSPTPATATARGSGAVVPKTEPREYSLKEVQSEANDLVQLCVSANKSYVIWSLTESLFCS